MRAAFFPLLMACLVAPEVVVAKPGILIPTQAGAPRRLLGFTVFGSTDDVATLERELGRLQAPGLKIVRPKPSDGRTELMVLFGEGASLATAQSVQSMIMDGKLGRFEHESILIPDSAVK